MRTLIIDSDKILSSVYKTYLEYFGHVVDLADDGQVAIDLIDKAKPDIILLEIQLKKHSGFEFLYELRSYPEWNEIPVILCTLLNKSELSLSLVHLEHFGVVDILYKPTLRLNELAYVLENKLSVA